MEKKLLETDELLIQVSKYMEFYAYQANRDALKEFFLKYYDRAFEAGSTHAVETLSEPAKEEKPA